MHPSDLDVADDRAFVMSPALPLGQINRDCRGSPAVTTSSRDILGVPAASGFPTCTPWVPDSRPVPWQAILKSSPTNRTRFATLATDTLPDLHAVDPTDRAVSRHTLAAALQTTHTILV